MQVGGSRIYSFALVCGGDASSGEHQGGRGQTSEGLTSYLDIKVRGDIKEPTFQRQQTGIQECLCWKGRPPSQGLGAMGLGLELGEPAGRMQSPLPVLDGAQKKGHAIKCTGGKKVNRPSLATLQGTGKQVGGDRE